MYTVDSTRRRIKAMGTETFITWILETNFSEEEKKQLEGIHIMSDGIPCLSAIYLLAQ